MPDQPPISRIRAFIDALRKKLIDQSGRNALINFRPRPTSRTSIELALTDFDAIWKRLVDDEARWRLVPHAIREVQETDGGQESESEEPAEQSTLRFLTETEINGG